MVILSGVFIFGLMFFAAGICELYRHRKSYVSGVALIFTGIALLCIATYSIAPLEIKNGAPVTAIDKGEYKVGFVYVVGDNVNLGIEKIVEEGRQKREGIFLYQFPQSAFDGSSINTKAKKLRVIESGYFSEFKRLVLE